MKVLSKNEVLTWLEVASSRMPSGSGAPFEFRHNTIPGMICRWPYRCRILLKDNVWYQYPMLANALIPFGEQITFLLWITDWGIWNELSERVGMRILDYIRQEAGDKRDLIDAPGHLFDGPERVKAQTLLSVAMWVGWDIYVISEEESFVVFNSHDEFLDVISADAKTHEEQLARFSDWGATEASRKS